MTHKSVPHSEGIWKKEISRSLKSVPWSDSTATAISPNVFKTSFASCLGIFRSRNHRFKKCNLKHIFSQEKYCFESGITIIILHENLLINFLVNINGVTPSRLVRLFK